MLGETQVFFKTVKKVGALEGVGIMTVGLK